MPEFTEEEYLKHYGILRRSGRYPYGSGGNELSEAKDFRSALDALRSGAIATRNQIAEWFGMGPKELQAQTATYDFAKANAHLSDFEMARALGITEAEVRSHIAINELGNRKSGQKMSEAEVAKVLGLTTNELRANIAISSAMIKQDKISQAQKLAETGMSPTSIGKEMGLNESSVRDLLAPGAAHKQSQLQQLADTIKQRVDNSSGYIDVGKGTEHALHVTKTKFDTALAMLRSEGYVIASVTQPTATTTNDTRVRVVAKPGETWSSIKNNLDKVEYLQAFSNDHGETPHLAQEPLHLNPSRLDIKYAEQGGTDADGVIYIRPGVDDLSMKGASYAQVRIQVGDGHFIKGMAVLKDGLPPGVDVQFNTNKSDTGNKLDALKPVKGGDDPIERFGAIYRQITDPQTGKVTSHLNIVNDDDDWNKWSKSLATQMLSKQKPDFVKRQLDVTYAQKKAQLDEIMALTNPVVKKKLLADYADDMDASAVHLKAAALPRQKTHVILPVNSLKDNEVYAPRYRDGERVVLIRYPHGGKFEIPELVVNNRNREAKSLIPDRPDNPASAIGINSEVAKRLSGADFDGDTVVVIPNDRRRIESEPPLAKLKNFDPQAEYRGSSGKDAKGNPIPLPGVQMMKNTQTQMGQITNLINDMTLLGANHEELTRAVRHSMVVIDAEKHGLDYKRSERENNIKALKKRYQGAANAGASTIISRVGRKVEVPDYKRATNAEGGPIDPKTGEPRYVPTGKTRPKPILNDAGDVVGWEKAPKMTKVATGSRIPGITIRDPKTGERRVVEDAYDLVSGPGDQPKRTRGTVVERHYAEYSNKVRDLANAARKAEYETPNPKVNQAAKKVYHREVASLKAKVKVAQANSPLERQAQRAAQVIIKMKKDENPDMSSEQLKRVKANAIRVARERVDAKPQRITITPTEWEAIQNGAVASDTLREVLAKSDMDHVRQLAQPKAKLLMQPHNVTLARALLNSGYTRAEVADRLGVSVSTLDRSIGG